MRKLTALWILGITMGCKTGSTDTVRGAPIAELVATQSSPYAVPPTAGGVSFTVAASHGAVLWALLDAAQLRAWWEAWWRVRTDPAQPVEEYTSESGATANLFARSARDGFCVAFAHSSDGTLREPRLVAFFDDM